MLPGSPQNDLWPFGHQPELRGVELQEVVLMLGVIALDLVVVVVVVPAQPDRDDARFYRTWPTHVLRCHLRYTT
jgi:hypothetical protein